jgi:hypothetical protein
MYKMFKDLGASRHFFTTLEPKELLAKHGGRVLHGNPKTERVVVLDAQMHPKLHVHSDEAQFCEYVLNELRKICSVVSKNNRPVFLMLFGHGDVETHGVFVGRRKCPSLPES